MDAPGQNIDRVEAVERGMGAQTDQQRRAEQSERLHASYDDPPRKRPWWQFWRRPEDEEGS